MGKGAAAPSRRSAGEAGRGAENGADSSPTLRLPAFVNTRGEACRRAGSPRRLHAARRRPGANSDAVMDGRTRHHRLGRAGHDAVAGPGIDSQPVARSPTSASPASRSDHPAVASISISSRQLTDLGSELTATRRGVLVADQRVVDGHARLLGRARNRWKPTARTRAVARCDRRRVPASARSRR